MFTYYCRYLSAGILEHFLSLIRLHSILLAVFTYKTSKFQRLFLKSVFSGKLSPGYLFFLFVCEKESYISLLLFLTHSYLIRSSDQQNILNLSWNILKPLDFNVFHVKPAVLKGFWNYVFPFPHILEHFLRKPFQGSKMLKFQRFAVILKVFT